MICASQFHEMSKLKKKYWKSYWVIAEWGLIIMAFVAMGLYAARTIMTNKILVKSKHFSKIHFSHVVLNL